MKISNNKLVSALVLVVILTVSMVSCSKTENEQAQSYRSNTKSVVSPSLNYFDSIGNAHNEILYHVGERFYGPNGIGKTNSYVAEQILLDSLSNAMPQIVYQYDIIHNYDSTSVEFISHQFVPFVYQDYTALFQIDPAVDEILASILDATQYYTDFDAYIDYIRSREVLYASKPVMTAQDTQVVVFLNVFEHSLQFWVNAIESEENPWHDAMNEIDFNLYNYGLNGSSKDVVGAVVAAGKWIAQKVKKIFMKEPVQKVLAIATVDALAALYGVNSFGPAAVAIGALPAGPVAIVTSGIICGAAGSTITGIGLRNDGKKQ